MIVIKQSLQDLQCEYEAAVCDENFELVEKLTKLIKEYK
jgi:hypothetical protein